jgi:hypothetical protein
LTIDGLGIDTWSFRDPIHVHLENGRTLHLRDQDVDIDTAGIAGCIDAIGHKHEVAALMCRPFTPADIKEFS